LLLGLMASRGERTNTSLLHPAKTQDPPISLHVDP
jgi:hypothetical protein